MANLKETQTWESGIYQIEKTDPVVGGEDGISNKQAKQLANRTAYLKKEVETKANKTDLTTGLNGKANSSHTHTMDNITGLQTALNGKANSSHTHTMDNITGLSAAMNAKANLASPTFTGAPKAPTPAQTVNDTTLATTAYVKLAIAALVGSAPAALDTLEELSNALAGDANLKQTLLAEIGKKANASHNHTMSQITDFEIKALTTEDLDTIKKTGFYKQDNNSNATTARHYPENKAGVLEVYPSVYGYMQVYRIYDNLRVYARNMASNGTWGSWARLDGRDKLNTVDFNNLKSLLVGIPFPYPLAAVPSGCLAFNGQSFNKTTYPILAQKYPSGVLPDLRGEFIRFWDNGRGVDAERALLSAQGDAIRNIKGLFRNLAFQDLVVENIGEGAFRQNMVAKNTIFAPSNYITKPVGDEIVFDSSLVVPTAPENRPRNIAFQAICLAA